LINWRPSCQQVPVLNRRPLLPPTKPCHRSVGRRSQGRRGRMLSDPQSWFGRSRRRQQHPKWHHRWRHLLLIALKPMTSRQILPQPWSRLLAWWRIDWTVVNWIFKLRIRQNLINFSSSYLAVTLIPFFLTNRNRNYINLLVFDILSTAYTLFVQGIYIFNVGQLMQLFKDITNIADIYEHIVRTYAVLYIFTFMNFC